MKKVSLGILAGVLSIVLVWYFFFKPFEFEVTFTAETIPGDIIQTLRIWNKTVSNAEVTRVDSVSSLTQSLDWGGRRYLYTWRFNQKNDSTTAVRVRVSEPGSEMKNKVLVPFSSPPIEKDAAEVVRRFYEVLQAHLEITRVNMIGESQTKDSFCVCRTIETLQTDKAYGMMKDYALLTSFVTSHNLRADGLPMVSVTRWSHNNNSLVFDFCFPIVKPDVLPVTESVTFREFKARKALKAEYYGNYITSDRAWYELIRFAHDKEYTMSGFPIEYFHNNPNVGVHETEWKAEVYLPVD